MMQAYAEYASYKDSGTTLTELLLPEHWRIEKCRFFFRFNKGLTITKENLQETGIPCVNYGEIHSKYGFEVDPAKHELKCVDPTYLKHAEGSLLKKGDFVFADTSEDIEGSGNFTYLNSDKPTFAGYHTLIARAKIEESTRFLAYVLDSTSFRTQVRKSIKGVKVYSITQAILKNTAVWLPPPPEQTAIADFLDDKVTKIESLVGIKRRQIELLAERKQILIQNAVTKGLNPNAPMKDSGVDWIGEIPVGWKVKKFRYAFEFRNNQRIPLSAIERGAMQGKYPYYGASGIIDYVDDYIFDEPLILIAEDGANLLSKSTPLAFVAEGKYWVNNHAHILKPKVVGFRYWAELLSTADYTIYISGAAQPKLTRDRLGGVSIPVPPENEIKEIIMRIEMLSSPVDAAVELYRKEIIKLNEYKVTLINAAVTGKIKVT